MSFGFVLGGSGELSGDCSGPGCGGASSRTDYSDEPGFQLGFDVLGYLSPSFRLGGGALFLPQVEYDADPGGSATFGMELSPVFIAEGLFDVGATSAITLRGFAGPLILFPRGDLQDSIDNFEDQCNASATLTKCDVTGGPYLGFTIGAAVGALFETPSIGIRPALTFQYTNVSVAPTDVEVNGLRAETTSNLSGLRYILGVGLEF